MSQSESVSHSFKFHIFIIPLYEVLLVLLSTIGYFGVLFDTFMGTFGYVLVLLGTQFCSIASTELCDHHTHRALQKCWESLSHFLGYR